MYVSLGRRSVGVMSASSALVRHTPKKCPIGGLEKSPKAVPATGSTGAVGTGTMGDLSV